MTTATLAANAAQTAPQKITDKGAVWRLSLLLTCLYVVSYLTRINYGAVISEIVSSEGIQKSLASLALTASAVTYGFGQLASGFLGDRINPKKLIFIGLLTTISMNILIPFCQTPYQMTAAWSINGLAQAFMWPPIVRIMTELFTTEDYKKSCALISCGASIGTIIVYALAPLCIYVGGWKSIFFCSAAIAVIMSAVWMKKCPNVSGSHDEMVKSNGSFKLTVKIFWILAAIMLAIVLQGILRDGVSTWMPSYIAETFKLDNKISFFTGVFLPLFSIAVVQLTIFLYKKIPGELTLTGFMFGAGVISAFALYATDNTSAVISVLFAATLSGSMHGVNTMMTCMIPPYFGKYGNISFMAGLLNFCTYIGSAASGFGLALFSENFGWHNTLLLWSMIALCGCLLCLSITRIWNKFKIE